MKTLNLLSTSLLPLNLFCIATAIMSLWIAHEPFVWFGSLSSSFCTSQMSCQFCLPQSLFFSISLTSPLCSTPLSNVQPSHTLPVPAHFLESVGAKNCPKNLCPHLFPVFSSLSTSLPSFKTLLCQEASQKLVAAVRLFLLPSWCLSYFPASSQLPWGLKQHSPQLFPAPWPDLPVSDWSGPHCPVSQVTLTSLSPAEQVQKLLQLIDAETTLSASLCSSLEKVHKQQRSSLPPSSRS